MCWKSPTLLRHKILNSCWLPQSLIWKTLGAEVEYEYLFHPEGPRHIWRAVDMKSWHLGWGSYLPRSQEETERQSYRPMLNRGHALLEPWLVLPTCCVSLTCGLAKIPSGSQFPVTLGQGWKRRILWPLCCQMGAGVPYPKSQCLHSSRVYGAAPKPDHELSYTPSCFL